MALATLSQKELLLKVRQFIPPLLEHFHKGQQGRVAVVGGCEDYTGAPFFSANASALLGADMSHVLCDAAAASTIKSYSPNIMVHPYLASSTSFPPGKAPTPESVFTRVKEFLPRVHVLVIGPGLGRDPLMQATAELIIQEARRLEMSLVLDADALMIVQKNPSVINGYKRAVLTPNVVEFGRLCEALGVPSTGTQTGGRCEALAQKLGGVTIVEKGRKDVISNGISTVTCELRGGFKRSGGQGDTLTGSLGTMLAWKRAYEERLWQHDNSLKEEDLMTLCAFGAAAVTRWCSRQAFAKKGRALQASDLSNEVATAFVELYESEPSELDAKL